MAQKKKKNTKKKSTQQYLDIAEIRDNIVVLKDGSLRAVLLASSINFALKSEEEQNAIIQSYISFLNSLDFPLQIVIQSRELNMDTYLQGLEAKQREQTNELLRTQIAEYHQYIKQLITLGEIMSKRFYVVVPYNTETQKGGKKGFFSTMSTILSPATVLRLSQKQFIHHSTRLQSRIDKVISGLGSMGITGAQLSTQNLIELYYNSYNPELSFSQKIPPEDQIQVE